MKKSIKIIIFFVAIFFFIGLLIFSIKSDIKGNNELIERALQYRDIEKNKIEEEKTKNIEKEQEEFLNRVEGIYEKKYLLDENDGVILFDSSSSKLDYQDNEIILDIAGYEGIKCLKISGISNGKSEKIEIEALLDQRLLESAIFYIDSKEKREFYFPCKDANMFVVKDVDKLLLDEICTYILPSETDMLSVKAGTFTANEITNEYFEKTICNTAGRAIVNDGKYVFSNLDGSLIAWEIADDNSLIQISQLDNICANIWKMEIDPARKIIAAVCRGDGVFIIDYSDLNNLKVMSHYDTNELATDVSIDGDYIAIASRYFGVEIVDISDAYNPEYVGDAWIAYEEFESCIMNGRYLYVGVWAQKKVEIFDLAIISKPVLISTIELDGKAYYMDISDDILFVATGQHASTNFNSPSDIGYGTGNGIEVYDVSNPEIPQWKSTVKANGRWFGGSFDTWGIEVIKNYAYFYNTYNGVYIYDISDVENPKLCTVLYTPITPYNDKFIPYTSQSFVFNYNPNEWINAPILDLTISNGVVYLISPQTGIYSYNCQNAVYLDKEQLRFEYEVDRQNHSDNFVVYSMTEENLWSVAADEQYRFLACGDGIKVLDDQYKLISHYQTETSIFDIKLYKSMLITAEGENGIGIYKISNGELEKIQQIDLVENLKAKTINISNDYVVVQTEKNKVVLVNISDFNNIRVIGASSLIAGTMYYRELAQGTSSNEVFYYKGLNGIVALTVRHGIILEEIIDNSTIAEHCGICVNGNYMYISNAKKISKISLDGSGERKEFAAIPGKYALYGKIQVLGKYLLCIEEIRKDLTIFEIEDNTGDLSYITTVEFEDGFPDLGCQDKDGNILIPLKHIGLAKINMHD